MISEKLQKVRQYEKEALKHVDMSGRPAFHLTGAVGWINDPNGFSVYKGEYHLFYQYHPYSRSWGPMHWGHVKTADFVRWERLQSALAPDEGYDAHGCFSGTAMVTEDGKHLLMYTGVIDENGTLLQQQCIAEGDGTEYTKYENNPVISAWELPADINPCDFRDPKIWKESNGKYYMAAGARHMKEGGVILLYSSEDTHHWKYEGILDTSRNQYGQMWECPDFFRMDDKDVVVFSPCEMTSIGLEFHPGHNTAALIGTFDPETAKFHREAIHALDYGLDFYAPQTLLSTDGRRIMIAWMQNWAAQTCKAEGLDFFGMMTLPRELTMKNGRIYQQPVREINNYRKNHVWYNNVYVREEMNLQNVSGRCVDIELHVKPVRKESYRRFAVSVAMDGQNRTTIRYNPYKQTVKIDRSRSGFPFDIVNSREFYVSDRGGEIDFRIILDKYSVELFVNDGEQTSTCVIYTNQSADSISFACEGEAMMDIDKYDLVIE